MNALEVRGLVAGYGGITVLRDIELTVPQGALVALVGANGAGKSTLLKCVSGIIHPTRGEIRMGDRRIERSSASAIVRLGVAHVPERRQIFGDLSVADNLRLGAYSSRVGAPELSRRISEMTDLFPALRDRLADDASALSGGQQQILAIARGLMSRPRILMLDEPSLGLAPRVVREIFDVLTHLRSEGMSILLVEQNARDSLAIADHAYVLETGRIVMAGTGSSLLGSDDVVARYLGVGASQDDAERRDRVRRIAERLRDELVRDVTAKR
ncbi:MAG TPA: ABC transporter ATP-binding protein [Candidatus Limnocylindria bacterium]